MSAVIIYIRNFLLEPIQPLWRYCLTAVPIALFPTLGLFVIACGILSFIGVNVTELLLQRPSIATNTSVIVSIFGSVFFAPIVETFLLAGLLKILSKVSSHPVFIAAYAAIIWGGLHGLLGSSGSLVLCGVSLSFLVLLSLGENHHLSMPLLPQQYHMHWST
jgi:membrane protease YdiL (CAAX protease family)